MRTHRAGSLFMRVAALAALAAGSLAGCGAPAGADAGDGATGEDGAVGSDAGSDAASPAPDDEALFEAMRAGTLSPADGMLAVARSGGWPIATASGYVFAHPDDAGAPWSLAGDHDGWTPAAMTLESGLWWARVVIATPDGARYKLVDGVGVFVADPWARRYDYDAFGEISLVASSVRHFERWPGMTDGVLDPRTLRVLVPGAPPTHTLYVHDGQNVFDPGAPWGGWGLQSSVGATTLVAAIDNTPARMDEYTHVPDVIGGGPIGGDGDRYADFVELVVRPLVEDRYGASSTVGVLGSSLGGLIAFHEVLRHPGRYDFAASLSGTFGWGSIGFGGAGGPPNETLIDRYAAAGGPAGTVLYLDSGGGGGSGCADSDGDGTMDDTPDASDNYCETAQLRDTLAAAGFTFDLDLIHWWEPGATHDEAAWGARVWRPVGIFEGL